MWFFPSNSSHFIQPLDSTPFAALKKNLTGSGTKAIFEGDFSEADTHVLLFDVLYQAIRGAFNPECIKSGFEKTGIWPWDPKKIINNTEANIKSKIASEMDGWKIIAIDVMTGIIRDMKKSADERAGRVVKRTNVIAANRLHNGEALATFRAQQREEKEARKNEAQRKKREKEVNERQRKEERKRK